MLKQILLVRTSETNSLKNSLYAVLDSESRISKILYTIWKSAIQELYSFNDKNSLVNQ